MAANDVYNISGSLTPARPALKMLGGAVDDGVQIDALAAAAVLANHTFGTISAWIMIPDITGTYAIAGAGDATAVEYFDFKVVAGTLNAYCIIGADVAWDVSTTAVCLTPYKWHHVVLVQDSVKPRIFVDGVLQAVTETDITEGGYWFADLPNVDGMHIGCTDSAAGGALLTNEFKGLIGTVKIWSATTYPAALTPAQILDDYNGVSNTTGLFGHYTWTDSTLYTDVTGTYNGTKVGDFTRVDKGCDFVARLQYEPAIPTLDADDLVISMSDGVGHAVLVKAA